MDLYVRLLKASLQAGFNAKDETMKKIHYIECRYYLKLIELLIELQAESESLD